MPNLATWIRPKDEPFFRRAFAPYPDVIFYNATQAFVPMAEMDGLLLSGGADIAPEFLKQELPDPSLIEKDPDPTRDKWEFEATEQALARALPIFAICKGMQVFNVALGGTLKLDIPGHNAPSMKDDDVQELRTERGATHRYQRVNSSHHQALENLGDGLEVEAWSAKDDIIEQVRLRDYPFALGVQYHPERGNIYGGLFADFVASMNGRTNPKRQD